MSAWLDLVLLMPVAKDADPAVKRDHKPLIDQNLIEPLLDPHHTHDLQRRSDKAVIIRKQFQVYIQHLRRYRHRQKRWAV